MPSGFNRNYVNVAAPCKGCADRHSGCHGSCEKYLAYKEEMAAYNEVKRKVDADFRERTNTYRSVGK